MPPLRRHLARTALALLLAVTTVAGPVVVWPVAAVTAQAAPVGQPVSEGVATDSCRQTAAPQQGCDTVRSATHGGAAICRRAGVPDVCTPLNGQRVAADEVVAYAASPTAAAHALQRRLQEDLPLRHATFVATHNSYNSYAYRPTPSGMDANQTYSLTDQLMMDVRRLELDVHTWTDVTTGQTAPILCHATDDPRPHTGCTAEMTLTDGLVEIDRWLDANPDEIVMLRVETHLDGVAGYAQAAAAVRDVIGDHLFLPPTAAAGSCTTFDLDLTRADIRASGRVMMVSDCGPAGSGWAPLVWDDGGVRIESTVRSQDFSYPTCAGVPRTGPRSFQQSWIRFFDDATLLSSMVSFGGDAPQRSTPAMVRSWTQCGVNQPSFDHLTPTDGRLAALAWSAGDTPVTAAGCHVADTRGGVLLDASCTGEVRPYLCATGHAALQVTDQTGPAAGHDAACAAIGAAPTVPRSGHEAQKLVDLGVTADAVWVAIPA